MEVVGYLDGSYLEKIFCELILFHIDFGCWGLITIAITLIFFAIWWFNRKFYLIFKLLFSNNFIIQAFFFNPFLFDKV